MSQEVVVSEVLVYHYGQFAKLPSWRCTAMFLVLLVILLLPAIGLGQLTPENALSVRQIQDPRFSPEGNRVAFTVVEPVKGTEPNSDIWIVDVKTGEVVQFTNA